MILTALLTGVALLSVGAQPGGSASVGEPGVRAEPGALPRPASSADATQITFSEEMNSVALTGPWEFFPGEFIMSAAVGDEPSGIAAPLANTAPRAHEAPHPTAAPQTITFPYDPPEPFGHGSFRLRIEITDEIRRAYYLQIPEIPSAWNVWVNGRYRGSAGTIGTSRETTTPQYLIEYYELSAGSDDVEIVIEYANYHSHQASILRPPELSTRQGFQTRFFMQNFFPLVINGIFLFLFVYHAVLFLMDRRNTDHLFFALFVVALMTRQILIGQEVSSAALYVIPWRWKYAIWYAMIPIQLLAFDSYIRSVFPQEASARASRILGGFTAAYVLVCLIAPSTVFTNTLPVAQGAAVIFGVYVHVVIVRAILHRRERAWMLVASSLVLFGSVINDILYSAGYLQTGRVLNFGALVFVLLQANMLSSRYSLNVRRVLQLTKRLTAINQIYNRFVPAELPRTLGHDSSSQIEPGDFSTTIMCTMILDVRDFTAISETMAPEENFAFINRFLERTAPIIRDCNGFITGFAGDQIRALFDEASDGVEASIKIQRSLTALNRRLERDGIQTISVGIGLAYGEVLVGAVGTHERLQLTTISDAASRAVRLEEFTRATDSLILCDRATIAHCSEATRLSARFLGSAHLGGEQETEVFELIYRFMDTRHIAKLETRHLFERAIHYLHSDAAERAETNLRIVIEENPADIVTRYYLARVYDEAVTLDGLHDA